MAAILFVTRAEPSPAGPGGQHRSYQIEYELKARFGPGQVHSLSLPAWQAQSARPGLARRMAQEVQRRAARWWNNPWEALHRTGYSRRPFRPDGFMAAYQALLSRLAPAVITVIDDARFGWVLALNRRQAIPTIACLHNLEALDLAASDSPGRWALQAHLSDFSNELQVLQQCAGRFFISRVETGLVSGLGLEAGCHPYLPVGEIRTRLEGVRSRRAQAVQDRRLFLVLGSAVHAPTRAAFRRFLAQAQAGGLPDGIRLVLAGLNTNRLPGPQPAGVESLGWLEQAELEDLLVSARAVLVPHFSGFGAVTRIAELSCAGVPVITARHPTWAIDLPPGVEVVGDDWPAWREKLVELSQAPQPAGWDYPAWEKTQPQPLPDYLARWMG